MEIIDFILHVDTYLETIIDKFGVFTYIILFVIIFAETGLVVTPFLPGDSLLFVIGAFSANGLLDLWTVYFSLLVAAILGDAANYAIGRYVGAKIFSSETSRLFNKKHLEKTQEFYVKHGGKTIIMARFLPIFRTFAPFVAGVGKMHYATFSFFNVIGGVLWVTTMMFAGYFFGGLPLIKNNFETAVILIILISLIPAVLEFIKHRKESRAQKGTATQMDQEIKKTFDEHNLDK